MQLPTFETVYSNLVQKVRERLDVVTYTGSVIGDTIIGPLTLDDLKFSLLADYTSKLQSLDSILTILNDETYLSALSEVLVQSVDSIKIDLKSAIDLTAENYAVFRKDPTYATGFAQFSRRTPCTSDITIPLGSVISSFNNETYITTEEVTMYLAQALTYYDSELGLYAITVPIQARTIGSAGRAAAYSMQAIQSSVPGFTTVVNKQALTGGLDEESDTDLIERAKTVFLGINRSSKTGLRKLVLDNYSIGDAIVIGANDLEMTRDKSFGGAIDIYIRDSRGFSTSWTFIYNNEDETFILGLRPAETVISISSGSGTLVKDSSSVYAGSIYSKDKIVWSVKPSIGTSVTVNYYYDQNITNIQDFINTDENNPLNSDILLKQGIQVLVNIGFNIVVFPGYAKEDVISGITTAINSFIAGFKFNTGLDQSDIIDLAYTVKGLDRVRLPVTAFNRVGETSIADTITVSKIEYINLNILSIT